jgi:hypothetical protein
MSASPGAGRNGARYPSGNQSQPIVPTRSEAPRRVAESQAMLRPAHAGSQIHRRTGRKPQRGRDALLRTASGVQMRNVLARQVTSSATMAGASNTVGRTPKAK